jgi:hypothetical protein
MATKKTETPTTDAQTYTPEIVTNEATALVTTVGGALAFTKSKAALKRALADDNAKRLLTTTLTTFVAVDCQFDMGMRKMGEICFNILKLDKDTQIAAIKALCDAQGIPMIEYNERAPRTSLARALFARFPDMQEAVQGGKDTKGALRVTSYIAAYKDDKKKPRVNGSGGGTTGDGGTAGVGSIRTAKELFQRLYMGATMKERDVLTGLAGKLGIQFEQWVTGNENPPAAS